MGIKKIPPLVKGAGFGINPETNRVTSKERILFRLRR